MSDLFTAICSLGGVIALGIIARQATGWEGVDGATMFIAGCVWTELRTKRTLRQLAKQIAAESRE